MFPMRGATSNYVYLVLPGSTRFTNAGRFAIESERGARPQGQFVYSNCYLDNPDAVPIDPVDLDRLDDGIYRTETHNGLFNSLHDSMPDRWALKVFKRTARMKSLGEPSEIDILLQTPDDRAGALGFGNDPAPPDSKWKFIRISELGKLFPHIDAVEADEACPEAFGAEEIEPFDAILTSLAGKRPKVTVEDADGLWVAKFNRRKDIWNHARIEHAMLELANACGINVVRSRVATFSGEDVLLVKRFDREKTDRGYLRNRVISGRTVLRAEGTVFRPVRWSNALLAEEMRRICSRPEADSAELFRRMVFHALIHKQDDGPNNHAAVSGDAGWELSPAYDLMPTLKPLGLEHHEHSMSCGIFGRVASARNMLTECGRFLLGEDEATAIIDAMEEFVTSNWHRFARDAGVTESDCRKIDSIIASTAFRHIPE